MIKGVHGTCRTWARSIKTDGFKASESGRAGPGCYFWRFSSSSDYAEYLGFKWWEAEHKKGNYNKTGVSDKECALLVCNICDDNELNVLDLTAAEQKENLREVIRHSLNSLKEMDKSAECKEKAISEVYAAYIGLIEGEKGSKFKACIADVAVPKGSGRDLGLYMGASAEAVVVFDTENIEIEAIKEIDNYDYV